MGNTMYPTVVYGCLPCDGGTPVQPEQTRWYPGTMVSNVADEQPRGSLRTVIIKALRAAATGHADAMSLCKLALDLLGEKQDKEG